MKYFLSILLLLCCSLQSEEFTWIILKGHLGKEEITRAEAVVQQLKETKGRHLVLQINSSSGDLVSVLALAKKIYELKNEQPIEIITFIDDIAVGPAAILPFLSDKIYASLLVSWGDIPLGSENTLPTNLLRNRVRSLIDPNHPKASVLMVLADAMSDPQYKMESGSALPITFSSGQTLVLNQFQLKELGMTTSILPLPSFRQQFHFPISEKQSAPIQEYKEAETNSISSENFQKYIHFHANGENKIGHILIDERSGGGINESTWLYVKKALEMYKRTKPIFIILELNTPGGEVFAAQKISDALKEMDTQFNIPVIAFINNWAISAGAMLAYSARFIVTMKDGIMGAAEPVIASQTGQMEAASEKVNSALRSDFASRASFFGRNPFIAEAMVDKDLTLVWRHNKVVKLESDTQIRTSGPDPDKVISRKGKLLTLTAEGMMEYGVANLLIQPVSLEAVTSSEQTEGHWSASKVALFHEPFFDTIPNAVIDSYRMDWKTRFFVLLATPLVSSLLFMGLMIGAYIELNHPGVSLPGIVAGACLFLIILSSFSLDIASWLELIFLVTGLILILVELFFVPSFGLIGILGIILFLVGLFGIMLPGLNSVSFDYSSNTFNAAGDYILKRLAWLSAAFIASLGIIILLARYVLPAFSGFNPFILQGNEQDASKGYIAGESTEDLPKVGVKGTVLAPLRPAGKVLIHGKIFDAISSGRFIEKDEQIEVVGIDAGVILVRSVVS